MNPSRPAMPASDTPETDAEEATVPMGAICAYADYIRMMKLARSLERRLAQAQTRIGELEKGEERLRALMEGLEVKEIDTALGLDPATLNVIGIRIARAAKLGAHLVPPDAALKSRP